MSASTRSGSAVTRRIGYAVAVAVNAVLLYLINERPGWEVVPFLTDDMGQVLMLLNASLTAAVVANLAYLAHDAPWLVAAGGVTTTGVGLAALIRLWQVFPFDFGTDSGWGVAVRLLLLLGIAGSVVGILAQLVALSGAIRRAPGHRSRPSGS